MADWARFRLTLPTIFADWVVAEVVEWGSPGVQILAGDPDEEDPPGPALTMEIYFQGEEAARAHERLRSFLLGLGAQAEPWALERFETVPPVDWAEQWRYHFPPLPTGERLLVLPPWEGATRTERSVILLQPGMAFGTGHHPTTLLALVALEHELERTCFEQALDVGCGSGILSLAALRLGVRQVTAIDYDADAVAAAVFNARMNGLSGRLGVVRARFPDLPSARPFPLVLANVYLTFFEQHAGALARSLSPRGVLLASGLQEDQTERAAALLEGAGLHAEPGDVRQGWGLVRAVRP